METLQIIFNTITGNIIYLILAIVLLSIIGYTIVKKLFKLTIIVVICLLGYLGYIYYMEGEEGVKDAGNKILKDMQEIPTDIKNQFKNKNSKLDSL